MAATPAPGHFLATIPLAWALRAAGHQVLLANTGTATKMIAAAGLPVVDVAPELDVLDDFMSTSRAINSTPEGATRPRRGGLGLFGEMMADGLLALARDFRPELLISTLEQGAGPLVATRLDVPMIEQSVRLAWAGDDDRAREYRSSIASYLEPTRARLGISAQPAETLAVLDVRPPRLGGVSSSMQWLMRYVPYNGSRVLPEWVVRPTDRARLCVTMGSQLTGDDDVSALAAGVRELAGDGVEIVLAMGDADLSALAEMPGVRDAGWMPLDGLLPSCAAVIHHGGAATTATAMVSGTPQVVVPRAADQPDNAALVAEQGAGLVCPPMSSTLTDISQAVARVLTEASFRCRSEELASEIAAQPSLPETVERLEKLVIG